MPVVTSKSAGYAGSGILRQNCVGDGVGNVILGGIRVTFGPTDSDVKRCLCL